MKELTARQKEVKAEIEATAKATGKNRVRVDKKLARMFRTNIQTIDRIFPNYEFIDGKQYIDIF